MSRVFVPCIPMMRKHGSNQLIPKFDLTPAKKWGVITELVGPNMKPFDTEPVIEDMRLGLGTYTVDDHLLCIGNPIMLGLMFTIAVEVSDGRLSILQWSGRDRDYRRVFAAL